MTSQVGSYMSVYKPQNQGHSPHRPQVIATTEHSSYISVELDVDYSQYTRYILCATGTKNGLTDLAFQGYMQGVNDIPHWD